MTKLLSDDRALSDRSLQTPVTPFERLDPLEVPEGFASMATESVKAVLEEVAWTIHSVGPLNGFSVEDQDLVQSSLSHDAAKTASHIVSTAMEEAQAEPDLQAKTWSCRRSTRRIQAFCAQRFAQNSIFTFVSKLREKSCCGKSKSTGTSVSVLLDGVDWVLEDVIPTGPDPDPSEASDQGHLYQTIADNISGERAALVSKRLNTVVYDHLEPGPGDKLQVQRELRASVDSFLQNLGLWIQRQVWLQRSGRDAASEALQKVEDVVQNLAESSSPPEGAAEDSVKAAAPKSRRTTDPKPTFDLVTPGPEPGPDTKTGPCWNMVDYKVLVMALVDAISRGVAPHMVRHTPEIVAVLTQKLCAAMEACVVSVRLTERDIERIVEAVKRELTEQWGDGSMALRYMLTGEGAVYNHVVDVMKRQLTAPKKKKRSFFSRVFSFFRQSAS